MVNLTEWSTAFPVLKGSLGIIKHVFSRSLNRFLSVKELLEKPLFECQGGLFDLSDDYFMVENSPEEIRDVVEEFLAHSDEYQYSELQQEFNYWWKLQMRLGLSEESSPTFPLSDVVEKYRHARTDSSEGTVGQKYLEQNWLADSYGNNMPEHLTV